MNFLNVSCFTQGDRYLNYSAKRGQMGRPCEKHQLTRDAPIAGRSRTMPDIDPASVAPVWIHSHGGTVERQGLGFSLAASIGTISDRLSRG
jgi:hypothetical protein